MLYPEIKTVKELLKEYQTVPVFYEILIDSYTPVEMFNALHSAYKNCFILESVDNSNQWGRYSFVGINPKMELIICDKKAGIIKDSKSEIVDAKNPTELISKIISDHRSPKFNDKPKLTGGLMGYFAYDMARYFEKTLLNPPEDDLGMPDADLFLFDGIVAYDHLSNKAVIILNIHKSGDVDSQYELCEKKKDEIAEVLKNYTPQRKRSTKQSGEVVVKSNITKEKYLENVEKAKEYIKNGDIFQVVPSQRFEIDNPPDSFDVYRALRSTNPSPYLYYFTGSDYAVAGASPEMLLSVNGKTVVTKPIAGSIKRGVTNDEYYRNEQQLISDPKERAEHTMLVDLGRNDIGRVCEFGSVEVTDFMFVERYSKVMNLKRQNEGFTAVRSDILALTAILIPVLP